MLRYMLLAGAAAVAIPGASLAQVQWAQPLPGENRASAVMNEGGPVDSTADYDIPYNNVENTGIAASNYGTGPADQARNSNPYRPDASDDTATALGPQPGNGVYGSQPAGGYYFSSQGDEPLASAEPVSASAQEAYGPPPEGPYGPPPEGAYSGQPYRGYGGGYYTNQPVAPSAYEGQGQGSYESTTAGQGLGGEGAYQQGQTTYGAPPASQVYGGGYYTGPQGAQNQPYYGNAPVNQGYGGGYYAGQQGAYGGQSAYYTGQPNAGQVQNYPSQGGEAYNAQPGAPPPAEAQPGAPPIAERPVVVLPARVASARRYVHRTTMASIYEIEAARIAQQRAQSPEVRDYANQMLQQHQQGLAIITQAAAQAGVPQRRMLDRAHRAMLHRLARVPDQAFDRVYMNQQLTSHMRTAAVQEGYLQNGDNPVLQQAAAQLNPIVQQNLAMTFTTSGMADRLAEQRSTELAMVEQNAGRGQVYRGYTEFGPTAGEETYGAPGPYRGYRGYRGYHRYRGYTGQPQRGQYQGGHYYRGSYNGAAANGPHLTPAAYQQPGGAGYGGATGVQGAPGTATPGTPGTSGYGTGAGIPGTAGYGTTTPGVGGTPGTTPGVGGTAGYGGPQYQGYGNPGITTPSSPGYQTFTTPGPGTTAPGSTPGLGTTTPGTPGYQGYTSPGYQGYAPPGSPGAAPTTPGIGATTPGATPPRGGTGPGA